MLAFTKTKAGPKLRNRPEACPRARLPAPVVEEAAPQVSPAEPLPQAPREVGPYRRVVVYDVFARCLDCHRQTGRVRGKFNFAYLKEPG
eukprot:79341-Amphidinium_carterae.1